MVNSESFITLIGSVQIINYDSLIISCSSKIKRPKSPQLQRYHNVK